MYIYVLIIIYLIRNLNNYLSKYKYISFNYLYLILILVY